MTPTQIYLLIAVMALVTYLIRVLPMVFIRRQIRNRFLRSFLYYVPYVTLSAMTFPAILQATDVWWAGALALGVAIFAALRTRSLFVVALVACGTVSTNALPVLAAENDIPVLGVVKPSCAAAAAACEALGYEPMILTDCLCCEAREAGSMLASIARTHARDGKNLAFLMGGETVVHLRGKGLGGRNQEIALSAALGIEGLSNALVFSVGSDGTDGPTDAAGGIADGETAQLMRQKGVDAVQSLNDNDAYHALDAVGGLIKTGATGTNVNDVTVLLLRAAE